MKVLRIIRNYFCYCGIEKQEYNKIKKDAYVSNFVVWRMLHVLMSVVFTALFISSVASEILRPNMFIYMGGMIYSILATLAQFFILNKKSIIAQFLIYLSISMLLLFGCFITANKPSTPATTFFVLIIITPIFMIDKPYFMTLELIIATTVFLIWMYYAKIDYPLVWRADLINSIVFLFVAIFIHIIANSVRINEFVLRRTISIQKDTDDLTKLKNKSALTREINVFLNDPNKNQGIFMMLDIDSFKGINDTFGHDVGDIVLIKLGEFLAGQFTGDEVVGRFGGDEFIIFIKNTNDEEYAKEIANKIVSGVSEYVIYPNQQEKVVVSIGISLYSGEEKNYSEIFKKADIALYQAKDCKKEHFTFYKN